MDVLLDILNGFSFPMKVFLGSMAVICIVLLWLDQKQAKLEDIEAKRVDTKGPGQYGKARFATKKELMDEYKTIKYEPVKWRKDPKSRPTEPGYLLGDWHVGGKIVNKYDLPHYVTDKGKFVGGDVMTHLCTNDTHAMLVASSGAGKTAFFLDSQIEYALATGISFVVTDTKGDIARQYTSIARDYYGYKTVIIDLRSPMHSSKFNIMNMVNKYTDRYKACEDPNSEEAMAFQAKRETFAKIVAKTIITSGTKGDFGSNSFFYDSAEGLLTACILLVAEYAEPEERHIVSVYKLIQSISGSENDGHKTETEVQKLMDLLPPDSKIKMLAGASAQAGGEGQASVISTAMSRLISFLDTETEQILCFQSDIDAENFVSEKTMLVLTMAEEYNTRYFLVSLVVQELYRELLTIADGNRGKVPATKGFKGKTPRVMFYLDEFGTLPKIDSAEMMFSAARSRNIFFVPIVQGTIQLDNNYGKEGGAIIRDNCQLLLFTGISPSSADAENFSKALGTYTIASGSISKSSKGNSNKSNQTKSQNLISRQLMTAEEIRTMDKGDFVIMRTGKHPMKVHFDLFLDWGIPPFPKGEDAPFVRAQEVHYASREKIEKAIMDRKALASKSGLNDELFGEAREYMDREKEADAETEQNELQQKQLEEEAQEELIDINIDEELEQYDDDDSSGWM